MNEELPMTTDSEWTGPEPIDSDSDPPERSTDVLALVADFWQWREVEAYRVCDSPGFYPYWLPCPPKPGRLTP
jgi:hypothetical protein